MIKLAKKYSPFLISLLIVLFSPALSFSEEIFLGAEQVLMRALEQNYGIRVQKLSATSAKQALTEYDALFDTNLFGSGSYERDELDRSSPLFTDFDQWIYDFGVRKHLVSGTDVSVGWSQRRREEDALSFFTTVNPYQESTLEFLFRQPLLKNSFGIVDRGERRILANTIERERTEIRNSIERNLTTVLQTYWNLVLVHETVLIRQKALKEAQRLFQLHLRKGRYGLLEDPDLLQTEVSVKERENEVLLASNNLKNVQEALRVLLAYSSQEILLPLDRADLPATNTSTEDELNLAFSSRRDLQQLKRDLEINQVALRVAKFAKLPQLDFVATLSANGIDPRQVQAMQEALTADGLNYRVGGELTWPLENRLATSQVNLALLDKASLILKLKKTEDEIIQQISEAVRNLQLRHELAKRNIEISKLQHRKFEAQERKFRQGRSSSDLVNRFLEDSLFADLNAASSVISFRYALIELLRLQNRLLPETDLDQESLSVLKK